MNMKKKVLTAVLAIALIVGCVFALTSCPAHVHTPGEWQHDETKHWKACTANDGVTFDEGEHNFVTVPAKEATATEDGLTEGVKCSICGYEKVPQQTIPAGHQHTFATEWSADETYHWHAATCEHTTEVKDKAEHTIIDVPGKPATDTERGLTDGKQCSVCKYWVVPQKEIPKPGEFSPDWSYDATHHWHAAVSGSERADYDEHTIVIDPAVAPSYEASGLTEGKHCSVCGAVIVAQKTVKMPYYDFVKAIQNTTNPETSTITVAHTSSLGTLNATYTITYHADGTATIAYSIEKFNPIAPGATEPKTTETGTVTRNADGTYTDGADFTGDATADGAAFRLDLTKLGAENGVEEGKIATATVPAAKTAEVLGTAFDTDVMITLTIAEDDTLATFSYTYTTADGATVVVTCAYN